MMIIYITQDSMIRTYTLILTYMYSYLFAYTYIDDIYIAAYALYQSTNQHMSLCSTCVIIVSCCLLT